MEVLERLKQRARKHSPRIVLPEGEDDRVIQAAVRARAEGYARPTLLGRVEVIRTSALRLCQNLSGIDIIDLSSSPQLDRYAHAYFERRKLRGITHVGGAANPSSDTIRAALRAIGLAAGKKLVSSFFAHDPTLARCRRFRFEWGDAVRRLRCRA